MTTSKANPWQHVTLKLFYGGTFKTNENGSLNYLGRMSRIVGVEKDEFCWFTLLEEAEKCGNNFRRNVDGIYYLNPKTGFKRALDDKDAQLMCEIAEHDRVVNAYLVGDVDLAKLAELIEELRQPEVVHVPQKMVPRRKVEVNNKRSMTSKMGGPPITFQKKPLLCETLKNAASTKCHKFDTAPSISSLKTTHKTPPSKKNPTVTPPPLRTSPRFTLETNVDVVDKGSYDFNDITIADIYIEYEEGANSAPPIEDNEEIDEEDFSDPGYEPDLEGGYDDEEDEGFEEDFVDEDLNEGFDDEGSPNGALNEVLEQIIENDIASEDASNDDEARESTKKLRDWNVKALKVAQQLQLEAESKLQSAQASDKTVVSNDQREGLHSDYDESGDEIHTPGESEEEDIPGHRRRSSITVMNERTDFTKLKWSVGIRLARRDIFRDCVTRYAVAQGRNLTFDVSDKNRGHRLGVRCISGCPFKMYGSWDNRLATYIVKSVDPEHTCNRTMERNRQLKSTWLAKQFLEVFKARPHWPATDIIETVRRVYKVIIKRGYAYKVKYHAHRMLHGSMKEHYSKIGGYIAALSQGNPNSFFTLVTKPAIRPNPPVFQRFFVCFDGLKQGWLLGCRKLLCVDACFLKTFLGGQLITAVGRDANEQMFPLAWAVVEGENNDSYQWFFQELKKCLGEENGEGWTFISDEHQSILTMVAKEFPRAEHRHCARHIFANWHKSFRGDEMKMIFWACAKAYNEADFQDGLAAMREVDPKAADAFLAYNPQLFCRAFISTQSKNDVIVNNMAETFNAFIIDARTKHVIYMLEDIRVALMQRLAKKKAEMEKKCILVCPRVQDRLEKEKELAALCTPLLSSCTVYEVKIGTDSLTVDLESRTCTCRKWDLTGIPCGHAISAIFDLYGKAEDYVDDCFKKETYLRIYSASISTCTGERHWPKVGQPLNSPSIKVGPGRPRKNRRKDPFEDPKKKGKLTRHGMEMTCSVCKSTKHNKRKCPDKDKVISTAQPAKRGRGRPRAAHNIQPATEAATEDHHHMTAQPTRIGRNGRVINSGRGGRGFRGGISEGGGRAGTTGRGGRGDTSLRGGRVLRGGRGGTILRGGRVPQGFGILFDDQGNTFSNPPRNRFSIQQEATTSYPSTQASGNQNE